MFADNNNIAAAGKQTPAFPFCRVAVPPGLPREVRGPDRGTQLEGWAIMTQLMELGTAAAPDSTRRTHKPRRDPAVPSHALKPAEYTPSRSILARGCACFCNSLSQLKLLTSGGKSAFSITLPLSDVSVERERYVWLWHPRPNLANICPLWHAVLAVMSI